MCQNKAFPVEVATAGALDSEHSEAQGTYRSSKEEGSLPNPYRQLPHRTVLTHAR